MKNITINEFAHWRYAHSLQVSPNGDYVVFQVTTANEKKNEYETNLWAYHSVSGRVYPLTSSGKDGFFLFLNDTTLLFSSGRPVENDNLKSGTNFWRIDLTGGEAQFHFHIDLKVSKMKDLGKGQFLLSGVEEKSMKEDWIDIDELPFWLNGQEYTIDKQVKLYLFDSNRYLEECANSCKNNEEKKDSEKPAEEEKKENEQLKNGTLKALTAEEIDVEAWDLSKDKDTVVFSASKRQPLAALKSSLHRYNLTTGETTDLLDDRYMIFSVDYHPEGKKVYVFAAEGEKNGINEDPKLYQMDVESKEWSLFSKEDFDHSPGNSVGTDARFGGGRITKAVGDSFFFVETKGTNAVLSSVKEGADVEVHISDVGTVESFDMDQEMLYFIAMRDLDLPELYVCDGKDTVKITDFSKPVHELNLSPIEEMTFSSNGAEISGFVIKPIGYEEGKKYPGLLTVHGGPKTVFGQILHHEMQLLASLGYFVFYTNPHGSDGFGVDYSDIRGKYGTIDYEDLMTFTDEVVAKYEDVDADRLGILGGSYGGFMTNWVIGHTDRFKAANAQRSISNWTSFHGVSDIGFYFSSDQTGTTPWTDMDALWNQSPLKYAMNATTPTLFIHSDKDLRCPLDQGIQMYAALKENGVDSKLVIFKEENHDLSRSGRPKSRVKRLEEIVNWFERYLGPNHENEI